MDSSNKRVYALIALAAGAILAVATRNRTPAEIRRFVYHPTAIEEVYAMLTDPMQVGMLAGAVAGSIGLALLRASDSAAQLPHASTGILLTVSDPAIIARASQVAEQATEQVLRNLKD